ncbi:MAG: lectin-like domain-containing protein [Hyphomicrobiaceae bacterium]
MNITDLNGGGEWGELKDWPIIGVHAILTPDNKLLTFGTDQNGMQGGHLIYDVWDYKTDTHYTLENQTPTDLFCSVPVLVPSTKKILIAGGDARPLGNVNVGVEDVNQYDYTDMSISPSPTGDMAYQRWYPTAINLANGKILMVGGVDGNGQGVGTPELYTPGVGWKSLTGAYSDDIADDWWYPRTWMNSDGEVVLFGTLDDSENYAVHVIDPSGDGRIDTVGGLPFQTNNALPAIMFEQDKVLILGADGSAWIMDISGDTPTYTRTADVGVGRLWSNLVVMADGRVLVSGGSAAANELVGVTNEISIWDPNTGQWTTGDDAEIARLYHSTTILLPDGSVLSLGGGAPGPLTNTNGEIFYPDYLFDENGNLAERPEILVAPEEIEQREDFSITVGDAADITRLTLVKAGSVTHALNMSTTKLELDYTVGPNNTIQVEVPDNANVLSAGQWMLFAFNSDGTPSIAATIQVGLGGEAYNQNLGGYVTLNGDAEFTDGNTVLLTEDAPDQAGAIMSNDRIDLRSDFELVYNVYLGTDDAGGDGMSFIMHSAPFGADEVGGGGSGLGASGLGNGLALEIDTYQSDAPFNDIANDHVGWVDTDAAGGAHVAAAAMLDVGNIEDGAWHALAVNWDAQAQVLGFTFDGAQGASVNGDLASTYFGGSDFVTFGFAASTGGATNRQLVEAVSIDATLESGKVVSTSDDPAPDPTDMLSSSQLDSIVKLYIGYFNRAPELDGYEFHIRAVVDSMKTGKSFDEALTERADQFYEAALDLTAFSGYSASDTTGEFVEAIYDNVLLRPGAGGELTPGEIGYWVQKIDSGEVSRGELVIKFYEAQPYLIANGTPEEVAATETALQIIENRITVAKEFAKPEYSEGLFGAAAHNAGVAALEGVDETQASVDAALARLEGSQASSSSARGASVAAATDASQDSVNPDSVDVGAQGEEPIVAANDIPDANELLIA